MNRKPQHYFHRWDIETERSWRLWYRLTPSQLFVGSFALLVLLGTVVLRCTPGLYRHPEGLSWLDCLFTATSAVCVTGLSVVDTSSAFTPAGQGVLLGLIQLGGLGMLTFTSLIILALGRRLSLREETLTLDVAVAAPQVSPRRLTLDIVRFTLLFELLGAAGLWLSWGPELGWSEAVWPAVFHSVSAFCNAGFSTFEDSLVGWQQAPVPLLIVMSMIVAGSLGFLTHEELYQWVVHRFCRKRFRVSLHSRLVLGTSGLLLLGGWLLFLLFESTQTLAALAPRDRWVNALFLSVTCRTAGFNTVDYAELADSSTLLTMILMTIGGSPGSTAGGMKTTTFALIGILAWSRLRGWDSTSLWGRTIPESTIARAVGLFVIATGMVTVGIFLLSASEQYAGASGYLVDCVFEAISAFNTVGLSMGMTEHLSPWGRLVICLMMFLGRVGPLTIAAALTRPRGAVSTFRYAHEEVIVG
jgi:trk system potassium uptake protein TrkH